MAWEPRAAGDRSATTWVGPTWERSRHKEMGQRHGSGRCLVLRPELRRPAKGAGSSLSPHTAGAGCPSSATQDSSPEGRRIHPFHRQEERGSEQLSDLPGVQFRTTSSGQFQSWLPLPSRDLGSRQASRERTGTEPASWHGDPQGPTLARRSTGPGSPQPSGPEGVRWPGAPRPATLGPADFRNCLQERPPCQRTGPGFADA